MYELHKALADIARTGGRAASRWSRADRYRGDLTPERSDGRRPRTPGI